MNRAGFSLVEAVVAVLLLSLIVGGALAMSITAALVRRVADEEVDRWAAGQSVMEGLVMADPVTLTSGTDTVNGYPVVWSRTGGGPDTFWVGVSARPGSVLARVDTFVTVRRR